MLYSLLVPPLHTRCYSFAARLLSSAQAQFCGHAGLVGVLLCATSGLWSLTIQIGESSRSSVCVRERWNMTGVAICHGLLCQKSSSKGVTEISRLVRIVSTFCQDLRGRGHGWRTVSISLPRPGTMPPPAQFMCASTARATGASSRRLRCGIDVRDADIDEDKARKIAEGRVARTAWRAARPEAVHRLPTLGGGGRGIRPPRSALGTEPAPSGEGVQGGFQPDPRQEGGSDLLPKRQILCCFTAPCRDGHPCSCIAQCSN